MNIGSSIGGGPYTLGVSEASADDLERLLDVEVGDPAGEIVMTTAEMLRQ